MQRCYPAVPFERYADDIVCHCQNKEHGEDLLSDLQERLLRFVEHRVCDPRILSLIKRWLNVGVLEDGEIQASDTGTPQGGSISILLSNIYLLYVLDLWLERVVKQRLKGEAYLVRYIDDFVICFQYREDALRVQEVLRKRLAKFGLALKPTLRNLGNDALASEG